MVPVKAAKGTCPDILCQRLVIVDMILNLLFVPDCVVPYHGTTMKYEKGHMYTGGSKDNISEIVDPTRTIML